MTKHLELGEGVGPRADIVKGMARAMFVSWWADEEERKREEDSTYELPYGAGDDIMDFAPRTSSKAMRKAGELATTFERLNKMSLAELFDKAQEEGFKDDPDLFGHRLGMAAIGHGVQWDDDISTDFEIKHPHVEYYESIDEARLEEMDPVLAIGAIGTLAVGGAIGAAAVKAWRTIKEFLALGKKTEAEKTYEHLSKDTKSTLRMLATQRAKRDAARAARESTDEVENDYGKLAQDVLRAVGDAKAVQARFLKTKGLTIEEARALPKPKQATLQREYTEWLKANESLDEYTTEWPSMLPIPSDSLTPGEDTVIAWPVQTRPLKPGESHEPTVDRDAGWMLRNYDKIRSFTVERARGDNPNLDCVVIAYTSTGATVAIGFEGKALARAFLEQACFDGLRVSWFGSEQTVGESEGWCYEHTLQRIDEMAKLSARGRKEILRLAFEQEVPDDDLVMWRRTTEAYMTDGHILRKRDVRFKPDSFRPEGRAHSYGWKDDGKVKAELMKDPAALKAALEKLRDARKAKGWSIESDKINTMGESIDEGQIDFHAKIPASEAGSFMEIVRAYAESHIVGAAGPTKKGVFVVNGQLSDEKGRRGNFIDAVRERKIGGLVEVGRKKVNEALDEGRSYTPPYVYEMYNAAGGALQTFAMAWRASGRGANNPGMGKPNEANLKKAIDGYNESLKPGGANAHIPEMIPGRDHVAAGGLIRRNEGAKSEVLARWGKLPSRLNVSEDIIVEADEDEMLKQAFRDWLGGLAHLDSTGKHYRIREHKKHVGGPSPKSKPAPWGKLVKERYPDVQDFHKAAQEYARSVRGAKGYAEGLDEGVKLRLKKVGDQFDVEYMVQWVENGKVNDAKSYYTQDKEDAVNTMRDMQRRIDASETAFQASNGQLVEVSPPGFKGTVKAMKKHGDIDNPYALAWWMKGRGAKSTYKADGTKKKSMAERVISAGPIDQETLRAYATDEDVLLALAPYIQPVRILDEAANEVEATEVMRINTRPKPMSEPANVAMSPLVAMPSNPSDYATYCVYDDGTVVRDQYRDGRQTRAVVASVPRDNVAEVVTAMRAIVMSYAGKDKIADVSLTISESTDEADMTVANEILRQLGGNKFKMMTGAKDFIGADRSLTFKIGRNDEGVSHVRIVLEPSDTYTVEFLQVRKGVRRVKQTVEDVYADSLQAVFTKHTGMYTSLGTMRHKPEESIDEAKLGRMLAELTGDEGEEAAKAIKSKGAEKWLAANMSLVRNPLPKDMGHVEPDDYDSTKHEVKVGGKTYCVYVGEDFVTVYATRPGSDKATDESADTVSAIRKVLMQNAGRHFTVKQLAMAVTATEPEAMRAASKLVTQGTAQFKRGDGYSLAGNPGTLQLPAAPTPRARVSDQRTYDYTQSDASKARKRKERMGLGESTGYAVVRGEKDALEYWTGEKWTDDKNEARYYSDKDESDAEAERLESEADETTVSAAVGGFRSVPLGKHPKTPINIGSVPDVEADVDDEEEDESIDEGAQRRLKLGVHNGPEGSGRGGDVYLLLAPTRAKTDEVPGDSYLEWDKELLNLDNLPPKLDKLLPSAYAHAPLSAFTKLLDAAAFEGDRVWESIDEAKPTAIADAKKYVAAIKNAAKKAYAEKYLAFCLGKGEQPDYGDVSTMAAQAVRLELQHLGIEPIDEAKRDPIRAAFAAKGWTVISEDGKAIKYGNQRLGAVITNRLSGAFRSNPVRLETEVGFTDDYMNVPTAMEAAEKHGRDKSESMGVGDSSIEVVKRKGKWYVVPPDGTPESEFDARESAITAAQGLARRENYIVVVTIGEAKSADEGLDEKLSDFGIDIEWANGSYTVTFPELRGPVGSGVQDEYRFDTLDAALSLARGEAKRQNFIVVVWNLKPNDTYTASAGAATETVEIPEERVEAFALAAQAAGVPLTASVTYEQGQFSVDLPAPQAARVRELLGVC